MKKAVRYIGILYFTWGVLSCGPSHYLPADDELYMGAKVKFTDHVLRKKTEKALRENL